MIEQRDILKKIQPLLNEGNKLFKEDFKNLFQGFNNDDLRSILGILRKNNIEIILERKNNNKIKTSLDYKNLKKLSNEQLCILYKQGNEEVLPAIIEKNEKLIWSRVSKHRNYLKHKLDDEDLFQSGVIGLIKAVKKYNNDQGANLVTYSVWWIDQAIKRDIIDLGFTIRIPVHMVDTIIKVNRIISKNNFLSKEEILKIAEQEGISEEVYNLAYKLMSYILSPSSLNTLIGEDEDTELIDYIVDEDMESVETIVEEKFLRNTIQILLDTITAREEKIIRLRFGLDDGIPRTLEEIGKEFGLTRERIRQIESKALRKLRHPIRSNKIRNYLMEE